MLSIAFPIPHLPVWDPAASGYFLCWVVCNPQSVLSQDLLAHLSHLPFWSLLLKNHLSTPFEFCPPGAMAPQACSASPSSPGCKDQTARSHASLRMLQPEGSAKGTSNQRPWREVSGRGLALGLAVRVRERLPDKGKEKRLLYEEEQPWLGGSVGWHGVPTCQGGGK